MAGSDRIVVLNQPAHGVPASEYAAELRSRLPSYHVQLPRTEGETRETIGTARVVTGMHMDEELLARAEDLELFAGGSAGVGHLPLDAFRERGVAVTNASGVHGPNIAEQVVGWLLGFARRLDEGWRRERTNTWQHFRGGEFQGSTVTVVGMGAIGEAVVERLDGFGVETIGARYSPGKGGPTDEVVGFTDEEAFQGALSRSEYVVVAAPLTDETRGLVGDGELSAMPTDAVLVNVGRGPIVDTGALVDAIRGNKLGGAALDVTDPEPLPADHPLWEFDNVRITPHNAGSTPKYWERLADILVENVERIEDGRTDDLRNQVVVPDGE
ncbi:phosphoglycerate dehydrogenase-like oxidoreductase [Halosimplex carlsbadense 2-9-1]|uniref:Phosphoglycerate dehydrogenase-like oxidoreductase n=1 Tax=Halosimplex carlsbadense 2-9-1 TaxID=797114 RepID=M0CK61_9EURY|nr:D-2-hydroxyacid dehydrogenase [Halosimplex carlsbadense]ELZ22279.1 phosphoglycerate dehydrogenase-like oxidoreductase [Halosimplex carlsbadense 2-9-1]